MKMMTVATVMAIGIFFVNPNVLAKKSEMETNTANAIEQSMKKNIKKTDKYYKVDNHCCKYKKKCKEKMKNEK